MKKTGAYFFLLICLLPLQVFCQSGTSLTEMVFNNINDTSLQPGMAADYYDEVAVTLYVPRIGSTELQAVIYSDELFLPITDLFNFLKIRNTISPDFDQVQGFIIDPKNSFQMDRIINRIVYQDKVFEQHTGDFIKTESNLYLKSNYFGKVFGLECSFDFRSLSVTLNTKIELPAIHEMQQELMRRNINRLKGEKKADTTIGRSYPLFHIGTADWGVVSSQETKGLTRTRLNLGIGATVAGGQLNLTMNYFSNESMKLRQQFYQWRYVNNELGVVKQITAGKLFLQPTSSIYSPVIGVQFTNTPTSFRKSFGTYTISNTTQPGWTVELYVNNVLINYVKADAAGFYTFQVPMVYGNSLVKLRFYGLFGEEQISEKYISIPFNFVPKNELEYTVSAGIVENDTKARFSRASFNYGLSRHLTIGGGMEYLSSVTSGKSMPFVQASLIVASNLLISGEHAYGVQSKGVINYRLPSNLQIDAIYIKYAKGQTAVFVNYTEEKRLVISMPLRSGKLNTFSRLTVNQFTFPFNKLSAIKTRSTYTSAEYLLSGTLSGVTSNLTTYALFNKEKNPLVYSNLSLAFRFPKGIRFSPQAQYEYRQKKFSILKAEVEKNLFTQGFLNLSYQRDLLIKENSLLTIGLRYNFSFAQVFFSASRNAKSTITSESARGSLLYDGKTNYLGLRNQSQLGRGGIVVSPFLDLNCNGKRDRNEPMAAGLKVRINGGHIENKLHDTIIRITNLEAYASYYLELDTDNFDNIAWLVKKHTIKVVIDPNQFKLIEVAVTVVGEASGTVLLQKNNQSKGLGRILVNIYDSRSQLVAKTLTESDGFFSFVGLDPGKYKALIDITQLHTLKMRSSAEQIFEIKQNINGDIVSDIQFVLKQEEPLLIH